MIRIYLALAVLVGAVLYRFPAARYEPPPTIAVRCQGLESGAPYQTLVDEKRLRFISRGGVEELPSDHLYSVPPLGQGYLAYSKIGKEISYFASPEELYWKRDSASYPVTDPEGRIILLLSGDLTAVRLMDRNGNLASSVPFSGVLMTDYAFANDWPVDGSRDERQPAAAVLFSGGPVYLVLYGSAVQTYRLEIPDNEKIFAKSIAIGGGRIAIHLQDAEGDVVRLFSVKDKGGLPTLVPVEATRLPQVFPHRVALALAGREGVLLSTAERLALVKGEMQWTTTGPDPSTEQQAAPAVAGPPRVDFQGDALVGPSLGAVGNSGVLALTDGTGFPLAFARRGGGPFRLLASVAAPAGADAAAGGSAAGPGITVEDRRGYCSIAAESRK